MPAMSNHTAVVTSLAVDEALALAEEAESIQDQINELHRKPLKDHAAIARLHARLGICLKLAEVHSNLAVAEQLRGLREDLADVPIPLVPTEKPHLVTFEGGE